MNAVVLHEPGGPDVLHYEEAPDLRPGEGEALLRVVAAGVNHYDLNQRAGGATTFPTILGSDAAGTLESGRRVLVTGGSGAYAELMVAPEERIWPLPGEVGDATAAALGVPYRTAWWSIVDLGGLEEGDTLLVQAGSSATGQAWVDIGRALGATVFATASETKLERLRELGAKPLGYDDPHLDELQADVVFDPVGADTFARSVAAVGKGMRRHTGGARPPRRLVRRLDARLEAGANRRDRLGSRSA